jgi:pimeloyl-ACP methyl ester carboxylesterase
MKLLKIIKCSLLTITVTIISAVLFLYYETSSFEENNHLDIAPKNGRFIEVNDAKYFVLDSGPREQIPVVLIAATAAWGGTWIKTVKTLNLSGFRTLTIDLPPFGFSDWPKEDSFSRVYQANRILDVLDSLGVNGFYLVAHSISGRAALETALISRERVKKLALVSTSSGIGNEKVPTENFATKLLGVKFIRDFFVRVAANKRFTRFFISKIMYDPYGATEKLVDIFRAPFSRENSSSRMGDWLFSTISQSDPGLSAHEKNYSKITSQTLIVWGRQDNVIPLQEGERLNQLIPNSKLKIYEKVNHAPHLEVPAKFSKTLVNFFKN